MDDQVLHGQGQRAIGGLGVPPFLGHLVGEGPRQQTWVPLIRADVVLQQPPLRSVGVGVVTEDGWGEQEGQAPYAEDGPRVQPGADSRTMLEVPTHMLGKRLGAEVTGLTAGTQAKPGIHQQTDTDKDEEGSDDAPGRATQPGLVEPGPPR